MPSVIYSSRRTNIMYSIIMQIIYNRRNGKSSWIRRKNWRKCSSYRLWRQNGGCTRATDAVILKQLSSMISVALRDSESGSNVSYLNILPNLQKTYTLNILVNISKYTCVKVESHIRNCIPQHRFHLFRHSILLLYKRKIIIANRATLFKW